MDQVVSDLPEAFRGKRVLVTGDTGFKGSWLCEVLLGWGAEVHGYALPPDHDGSMFEYLGLRSRVRHRDADIRDLAPLRAAFDEVQPDFLFHLAAQALVKRSYAEPKLTYDTNVGGFVNVMECARSSPSLRSAVFITSDKCYLNKEWVWGYRENDELGGRDPYSASKAAAEIAFASYSHSFFNQMPRLGVATARAGNVIGGGDWSADRIVPDCIRALRAGRPIVLRSPDSTRPWQHVLEPLSGYLMLAAALVRDPRAFGGSWNFGPRADAIRTVEDLANGIALRWEGGQVTVDRSSGTFHEAKLLHLNCDRAAFELGWRPRWDFSRTVEATAAWYRSASDPHAASKITQVQVAEYFGGNQ